MKKIIATLCAVLFLTTSFATALSVGARGNWNLGLGTSTEEDSSNDDISGNSGFGMGAYVNFGLLKLGKFGFGIQPEVNFNFNNGWNYVSTSSGFGATTKTVITQYTNTLDIPVLLTFDIPLGKKFTLGLGAGPMLSIPVTADGSGSSSFSLAGISLDGNSKLSDAATIKANVNWGTALDVNGKINFGPLLRAVIDLRYNLDLTPTQFTTVVGDTSSTAEAFTRRSMNLGLGIEIGF